MKAGGGARRRPDAAARTKSAARATKKLAAGVSCSRAARLPLQEPCRLKAAGGLISGRAGPGGSTVPVAAPSIGNQRSNTLHECTYGLINTCEARSEEHT